MIETPQNLNILVIQTLALVYLGIPALTANVTPVFAAKLPWLRNFNAPLDFGKEFRGKRILGANKTIRGLITGTIIGVLTCVAQWALQPFLPKEWYLVTLTLPLALLLGFLLSMGALIGDAVKSFFKRQMGIPPGSKWAPWDNIDVPLGILVFMSPIYTPPLQLIVCGILIAFLLHKGFNYFGYWVGIKNVPW